jgi:hypothetical protein
VGRWDFEEDAVTRESGDAKKKLIVGARQEKTFSLRAGAD